MERGSWVCMKGSRIRGERERRKLGSDKEKTIQQRSSGGPRGSLSELFEKFGELP